MEKMPNPSQFTNIKSMNFKVLKTPLQPKTTKFYTQSPKLKNFESEAPLLILQKWRKKVPVAYSHYNNQFGSLQVHG